MAARWRLARRVAVGVMMLGVLVFGGEATTRPSEEAERLIGELSSDSWQVRQKAQEGLVQLGPEVGVRLRAVLRGTNDEEVRARVEAVLRQLEEMASTGASLVTLHMRGASPREVFAEISKQANTDLRPNPADLWESRVWPGVDVDIEGQPFWVAMKEVCDKVGVGLQSNGLAREMTVTDRNMGMRMFGQSPGAVSGAFLFTAANVNTHRAVDLNQPGNVSRVCSIQMLVFAEPKIRVLQGSYVAKIEQAVDEKGNSLVGVPRAVSESMQPPSNWFWNLSVSLQPPAGVGQRIAKLKGTVRFIVQTRAEKAEVGDVIGARNVTKVVGGKRFTLKGVRKQGELYVVQMTLYRSGWTANEWMLMYPYNVFKLVDGKGNPLLRTSNAGGGGGGGDEANVNLTFRRQNWPGAEDGGEPAKLVWEIPIESKEMVVPFEFRDLPMP
ncbi:MAG: hypothetical protein NTU53_07855 [Planctomycetota bacterium]|nr:hypothetical protein [Planctomycetota bacterium]